MPLKHKSSNVEHRKSMLSSVLSETHISQSELNIKKSASKSEINKSAVEQNSLPMLEIKENDSLKGSTCDTLKDLSLAKTQPSMDLRDISHESVLTFFLQSLPPLIFASVGLIGTGVLLDKWQCDDFYTRIHEALMLTPALLGLKGNIEMTFASRLTTLSHLGKMDNKENCLSILGSNMALVQIQAIIVSYFATTITVITESVRNDFSFQDSHILAASAISSTTASSVILCLLIMGLVVIARKLKINPDNVMSPLASSMGDLITFLFFVGFGTLQITCCSVTADSCWLSIIILTISIFAIPFVFYFAYRNIFTRQTLIWGWFSVIFAAIISSAGGYILERSALKFKNLAMFQPILSGLAGNRAAVQCSRLSTCFHISCERLGVVDPKDTLRRRLNPWYTFNAEDIHSRTALVLIACTVPSHLLFMSIIIAIGGAKKYILFNWQFFTSYCIAAFIQVVILMYFAQLLVYILWRIGTDPDHSAIPVLTSIADLFGVALLLSIFEFLSEFSPESIGKDVNQIFKERSHCIINETNII
uniref:SLC41A/MgtE integral membrane domain-containing protein n=1 Tax=Panagrolaimus superbus TaxID=310955 RepID=A0A914Y2U1_9BILA